MSATEILETTAVEEPVPTEVDENENKEKKKSSKKAKREESKRLEAVLSEPVSFKKIDFDNALTKDEKSAKKAAKLAAKKAKKDAKSGKKSKSKEKIVKAEAEETLEEKSVQLVAFAVPTDKPEKSDKKEKKSKKDKKGKKKDVKKVEEEESAPESVVDQLRRRASVAQEVREKQERRQSIILERRASKVLERRQSLALAQAERESLVQIAEETQDGHASSKNLILSERGTKKKRSKRDVTISEVGLKIESSDHKGEGKKKKKSKTDQRGSKKSLQDIEGSTDAVDVKQKKGTKSSSRVSFSKTESSFDNMDRLFKSDSNLEMDEDSYMSVDGEVIAKKKKKKGKKKAVKASKSDQSDKSTDDIKDADQSPDKKKEKKGKKDEKKKDKDGVEEPKVDKVDAKTGEVQAADATKGKGKGKGKKKKGEEEKVVAEKVEEELSVFDQIALMKAQAAMPEVTEAPTEVTETTEKTKKSGGKKGKSGEGKKKHLSKQEKMRAEAERVEQARIQAELDAAAAEVEVKRRIEREKKEAIEKNKREISEQHIRIEQLHNSTNFIQFLGEKKAEHDKIVKREEEWVDYLKCGGLPDPSKCAVMNTYLHLWEKDLSTVEIKEAERRTNEVLKLLEVLDYFIEAPYKNEEHKVDNWIWVRSLTRAHQHENLESATYRLLCDIDGNLVRLNIPTSEFRLKSTNFSLCLWLLVQLPIPVFNPRTPPRPRIDLQFPEMGMKVYFPASLECVAMAIRAMYVKYDHLSDTCETFARPPIPEEYQQNLLASINSEWHAKLLYKYERRKRPQPQEITLEDGTVTIIKPEPEPELPTGVLPPIVPYQRLDPTASTWVINFEDSLYADHRERLMQSTLLATQTATTSISLSSGEPAGATSEVVILNLRKVVVLGGVYSLHVYYQPPQPLGLVSYELVITALQKPLRLKEVPFFVGYKHPPPVEAGVRRSPEEIEEEIKKQEAEFDELILITLDMPQHIVWLDVPQICYWDEVNRVWRTDNIYDFKHIEEKNYVTFRTGIFGQFALATNKYASLPYQAWELRPEIDGTVTLQLTTAILLIEFNVKGSLVSLTQLQNSPNNALQDIIGTYFKLPKLRILMVRAGVDIFPAFDTFCYVTGTCEKHWPMETHLYYNMAQLSNCFNFAWSRWNLTAGRRTIVCQMREFKPDKVKQKNHSMLMVTPLKALFVDCTEVSQVFNENGFEDTKFCADLTSVIKLTSNVYLRRKIKRNPPDLINTLSQLLIETRMLSFS